MRQLIKNILNNKLNLYIILSIIITLATLTFIFIQQQNIKPKVQENTHPIKEVFYLEQEHQFTGEDTIKIELKNKKSQEQNKQIEDQNSNIESEVINEVPQIEYEVWELTAYTSGFESTGKTMSNPAYRITASGEEVKANYTIACPRNLPFGTEIYIPYFDNTFTCKDRGGAIKGKRLDVYMETLDDALEFGRRKLEIKILD